MNPCRYIEMDVCFQHIPPMLLAMYLYFGMQCPVDLTCQHFLMYIPHFPVEVVFGGL